MFLPINRGSTPVLYHGTRRDFATKICAKGFKKAKTRSYTGHGVCMSESVTIAYEYGQYETGGVVIEVRLDSAVRWVQHEFVPRGTKNDTLFKQHSVDALRIFGGNVWVLGNVFLPTTRRILTHAEALSLMTQEFDTDGPDVCYNGVVDDYASIWWGNTHTSGAFARFPNYQSELTENLMKHCGKCQASLPFDTVAG